MAALRAVCILDRVEAIGQQAQALPDRAHLKWAAQLQSYERTILPQDFGDVDVFAVREKEPGIFLHSLRDTYREPVVTRDGSYRFHYKVFAEGFPLLAFAVEVQLDEGETDWKQKVMARLLT